MSILKKLINMDSCYGCTACFSICPKQCIKMHADEEGFLRPFVDALKCVECGMCEKVCPVLVRETTPTISLFAARSSSTEAVKKSSSGGIFIELAKHVIDVNGVVCATVLNKNLECEFMFAENYADAEKMCGSKYVQSNPKTCFTEIKKKLASGQQMLFVGTPCQVAGLRNYLGKDYNNLLCVDFICHGVPSPKFFSSYITNKYVEHGKEIISISFRDKTRYGWSHAMKTQYKKNNTMHTIYETVPVNSYFYAFMKGYNYRPSCYNCQFTTCNRVSDITLGDFWNAEKLSGISWDATNGASMVLVNTDKGKDYIDTLYNEGIIYLFQSSMEIGIKEQTHLSRPIVRPEIRDTIYKELDSNGYEFIEKKYLRPDRYLYYKISSCIPKAIREALKRYKK